MAVSSNMTFLTAKVMPGLQINFTSYCFHNSDANLLNFDICNLPVYGAVYFR
jgi:hypothetical protein